MSTRILLAGASGYIGGQLLHRLQDSDWQIRCLARRPEYLAPRLNPNVECVYGDVQDYDSLVAALQDVDVAFYFVHSMGSKNGFVQADRVGAQNFGSAAKAAGVGRIIYLGGLGKSDERLSPHLASRHETGEILRGSGVPTLEFRASVVIGAGSLSFELIRALVEKLPIMITPRWVRVRAQPISIIDLLDYLEAAISIPLADSEICEIGGEDALSYEELMLEYARQRGLRRRLIPVPLLTPWLSSLWLGMVTPLFARIGRKLIDSLRHPTLVLEPEAAKRFGIQPRSVKQAIADAIADEDRDFHQAHWSDSLAAGNTLRNWGGVALGSRLIDHRSLTVSLTPEQAFEPIRRIGGSQGWYFANWLWELRGLMDLLVGGVGLRRGRRHPRELEVGEVIDWWRVERIEDKQLLLAAEMRVPGRAWLQLEVAATESGSIIYQTAIFEPLGLWGRLYWYCIFPLHVVVFRGMIRGIAQHAKDLAAGDKHEKED